LCLPAQNPEIRVPQPFRHPHLVLAVIAILALALASATDARAAITCKACGEEIEGEHLSAGGDTYHPQHFVCGICSKPFTRGYVLREGKHYHSECFEQHLALRCDVCGGVISGRYLQNYWGQAYHSYHKEKVHPCEHCSRPITQSLTGGGYEYDDGRFVCGICYRTAVKEAGEILKIMRDHMRRFGLDVETDEVRLHLVGLDEIRAFVGNSSHDLRGYTDYEEETLLGITTKRKINVYILYGMPREDAVATMAHELTHVWQAVNGQLHSDDAFSEGSCNYASYLVLEEYTSPQSQYLVQNMKRNEDEVYGEGFRRVKRFAEEKGIPAWIRQLRDESVLPSGY
jgi:hypothetical protein